MLVCVLLLIGGIGVPAAAAPAGRDADLEASILRVKPAVVLVSTEVDAEVTLGCGHGPSRKVMPGPLYTIGSGFLIHPDGYIATNGHVVETFYGMNEQKLVADFVRDAVRQACGPVLSALPEELRKERLRAIAADPANRSRVRLVKKLQIHLSNGRSEAADIKAYSPAINPDAPLAGKVVSGSGKVEMDQSGKDVAILKIEGRAFPTARLASRSRGLQLGEQIFILGYPGVVLDHDFLSRKSRLEASVTSGRVSGFKLDITDRRVIQTDTPITWGNSGGPACNVRGEVVGVATFLSTTQEGDQAIQGFNFLIPVESVLEFARQIGLTPSPDSPFQGAWERGVQEYFRGEYSRSITDLDAAERILPGFPDVRRLRAEAQLRLERGPQSLSDRATLGVGLGVGLGVAILTLAVRTTVSRRMRCACGRVRRISPDEVRKRLDGASPVALVDARRGEKYAESPVQAAGAVRYDVDQPDTHTLAVRVSPSGQVVVYCDCPDEATSTRVALQLMQAGYNRVAVVRGGLPALMAAGVEVAPKDVTPPATPVVVEPKGQQGIAASRAA